MFSSTCFRLFAPWTALTAALLTTATACGGDTGGASGDATGTTRVIGSFYPMAWLAERVGGGDVSVTTLTKPGAEPHDLELTPRQIGEISDARLVVYIKGVQPAVDKAVDQQARGRALDAASAVKTLPPPAADAHGHGEGEHDEGEELSYDPHLWLDPSRLATVATALGTRLAAADPGRATTYRANAAKLARELNTLDGEFKAGLAQCRQKTIVTAHAAFGYLADRYGLKQISIAGVDPGNEPSPKRLAELTHEIEHTGATTIFTETLVSPKVAEALAREAKVRTAVLDPVEGLAEGAKGDYLSVMRTNLRTLRGALGCGG
ncbi:metal ABC transporter substrate-binding protein [Actinomadura craniellae]|uniref:metal ABC transporter substrate-binding protein n=1 Tax=Actinomadura craniellae TaxID=2231787 RepID=UPI001F301ED6|nr:metal ABC transporter substrate-binding protein [Actinomadura craniellae]